MPISSKEVGLVYVTLRDVIFYKGWGGIPIYFTKVVLAPPSNDTTGVLLPCYIILSATKGGGRIPISFANPWPQPYFESGQPSL